MIEAPILIAGEERDRLIGARAIHPMGSFLRRQFESARASLVPIAAEEDPIAVGAELAEGI
jgi:hypothetical protein